jgi:hypothetical protein
MTSNLTKPQPTAPGWWWGRDRRGRIVAVEIAMHEGEFCMLTSTMYPWPISATDDEWLGPVLSREEVQQLRQRIADLEAQQAQWDGPVHSRVEEYKRHVMGAIDEVNALHPSDCASFFAHGHVAACEAIRNKINEAKAGAQ